MATDDSLLIAADAPSVYRPASPTRLLVYGSIAVAFALLAGLAFNEWAVGRYVWLGAGLLTVGTVLAVLRRISARSSEHIRVDSDSITWVSPGQCRSLPWRSIEALRIKPWQTIDLSDATHAATIAVTRRFERFPYLVAEVLQRLESAHESRMSRAHFGPKAFASSIRVELLEALGSVFFTAACAWMAPVAFLFGLAGLPLTPTKGTPTCSARCSMPVPIPTQAH